MGERCTSDECTYDSDGDQNERLHDRSGHVESSDLLVGFLYDLLRDHLPAGTVEALVREQHNEPFVFTNGYLASYAQDLAARLCGCTQTNATRKITLVYGDDWTGLYVDGKLKLEQHSLSTRDALIVSGMDVETLFADEKWLDRRGSLPSSLSEVVLTDE